MKTERSRWFAWHPVRCSDTLRWVWLRHVEKVVSSWALGSYVSYYQHFAPTDAEPSIFEVHP